jgi:hypothetical protein
VKEKTMHTNRNSRNAQQLRSLIQNMGRSIDEARARRMGPDTPTPNPPAPARPESTQPVAPQQPGTAPPIRAANEMFVEGGQRLKARPKRPA